MTAERKPLGISFSAAWDKGKSAATSWHPNAMPSTYIVDKKGALRFTHQGYSDGDEAELERQIQKLLTE